MKQATLKRVLFWLKRFLGFAAVVLSVGTILVLLDSPAPFIGESPYAAGSSILIFLLLSISYKAVEYWEKNLS